MAIAPALARPDPPRLVWLLNPDTVVRPGALRALVTQVNPTNYAVRFHAVWGSHSGSFNTKLIGQREGDEFVFVGRKRILGFLITTRGHANATNFFSTYESRFDTGTFTLKRPAASE